MNSYPRRLSQIEKARRTAAFLFGAAAFLAVVFAELSLQSIPELGALIILPYAITVIVSAAVGRVSAKQYFSSISTMFSIPPSVAVPIYSLGLGFLTPVLLSTVMGDIGFSYLMILTAVVASPVTVVGGAIATLLMKRRYGIGD